MEYRTLRIHSGKYDTSILRQALIDAGMTSGVCIDVGQNIVSVLGDMTEVEADIVDGVLRTLNKEKGVVAAITNHNDLSGLEGGISGNYVHAHYGGNVKNIVLGSEAIGGGQNNVHIGYRAAVSNLTGNDNVVIGSNAGRLCDVGIGNCIIGAGAGLSNRGHENVFIGSNAAFQNIGGADNVVIGGTAAYSNTTGNKNVIIGKTAAMFNASGGNNVVIGYDAGRANISGSGSICIGYQAGYSETNSNRLYIANSNTVSPLIYGEFDTSKLKINGELSVTEDLKLLDNKKIFLDTIQNNKIYYDGSDMIIEAPSGLWVSGDSGGNVGIEVRPVSGIRVIGGYNGNGGELEFRDKRVSIDVRLSETGVTIFDAWFDKASIIGCINELALEKWTIQRGDGVPGTLSNDVIYIRTNLGNETIYVNTPQGIKSVALS